MTSGKHKPQNSSPREELEAHEVPLNQEETVVPDISREQTAKDTLARYSDCDISEFQSFILLTNFYHYVEEFADKEGVKIHTGPVLRVAHQPAKNLSIIDYRVGSPMAALLMDTLSYIKPQCVLMLGLCGGLHRKQQVGDFLLPMAAIRDEGASRHYMPEQVPSLPAFMVQKFIAQLLLEEGVIFRTGVIHSTDYRMWEFDEGFKNRLLEERATAIDIPHAPKLRDRSPRTDV